MNQLKTIMSVWEKFNKRSVIKEPLEIELFLNNLISETRGNLNVDFIDGGFGDRLIKVIYRKPYFYLYWKDFSEIFDKFDKKEFISESELMDIAVWGNKCYIYQLMSIKSLYIFELIPGHPMVAIESFYLDKADMRSELMNFYSIQDSEIREENSETTSYQEFVFRDKCLRGHSCQYIQLPNFNLLIQDKVKPTDSSGEILRYLNENVFKIQIKKWEKEIIDYIDYYDDENLSRMCFEIRLYTEKLLKYFLCNLIKTNEIFLDGNVEYNLEEARKLYIELLEKYPHELLGKLKNKLKKSGVPIKISQGYLGRLNKYCHETGGVPKKDDVNQLIIEFNEIRTEVFLFIKEHKM